MSQNDAARALDEVNLDDMFADDGGGGLFEGLDVDLDDDAMGEIMDGTPTADATAEVDMPKSEESAADNMPDPSPPPPPPPLPPNRGNRPTLPPGSEDMDVEISSTSRSSLTKVRINRTGHGEVRKSKRKRRAPSRPVDEYHESYIPPELLKDSIASAAAEAAAAAASGSSGASSTKQKKKKESSKKKKKSGPVDEPVLAPAPLPETNDAESAAKVKTKRRRMLAPPSSSAARTSSALGRQHSPSPAEEISVSSLSSTTGASTAVKQRGMSGSSLPATVAIPGEGKKKRAQEKIIKKWKRCGTWCASDSHRQPTKDVRTPSELANRPTKDNNDLSDSKAPRFIHIISFQGGNAASSPKATSTVPPHIRSATEICFQWP
mmetsp:Transcript_48068/g.145160  ORF Transcript_48068/g.145160 Transcript_48068/m.145160 type:complete len:378 (-) Transcript_48068:2657-3790(-)